jgi:hypothetical protein
VGHSSILVLIAVLAVGCGVEPYLVDRGLDITDVVDFKIGVGLGIGAKAQVTDFVGAGLGAGNYDPAVESFGRRFFHYDQDGFLHGVVFGLDGTKIATLTDETTVNIALLQLRGINLPLLQRFRVGGEILLPGLELGLWVNLGEVLDLICGVASFDPALDDGMNKGTELVPKPPPEPAIDLPDH